MEKIIVNPVTRISGFMEIEVHVENNVVVDAQTKGLLLRGFEQMLVGRSPFDAVYFTQRICGICSTAHAMASSLALEDALHIQVSEQGKYLRDILHGCEFLQNHIRHFYQYTVPDYVKLPTVHPLDNEHDDYRLPEKINKRISDNYFKSLKVSRLAHEMLSVLGGKAPHNHGIFVGGIAAAATTDKIIKMKSLLQEILVFINEQMLPDAYSIAEYYPDYFKMGNSFGNLLSFGVFNHYKELGTLYVDPLVFTVNKDGKGGIIKPFNQKNLTENIDYSWYKGAKNEYTPTEITTTPDMSNPKAYSWVKAPRYNNLPYEVGPLARLWLTGEYRNGLSAMDRTLARAIEAKKIAEILTILLDSLLPNIFVQEKYEAPQHAEGSGLIDTTRGALGHWLKIENKVISFYQIITPSAWDFSTRDTNYRGTAEEAVIGTKIRDMKQPVELGRILRSFDPCMSCATHVYSPGHETTTIRIL